MPPLMSETMRLLKWILIHGSLLAAAYYGAIGGIEWAANITKFCIWTFTILQLMIIFSKEGIEEARETGSAVPVNVGLAYDAALAILLASQGWFMYAGLMVVVTLCYGVIHANTDESPEKGAEPEATK